MGRKLIWARAAIAFDYEQRIEQDQDDHALGITEFGQPLQFLQHSSVRTNAGLTTSAAKAATDLMTAGKSEKD